MTNHVVRLYAFAGALLVLFLTWAAIAAHPWAPHCGCEGRPSLDGACRARAEAPPRVARRAARRGAALAGLPRPAGCPSPGDLRGRQPSRTAARGSSRFREPRSVVLGARLRLLGGALGARRDPASRDDHEDLVIQRRSFRAMGTDVALFLAAEPGPAAEAAIESAEQRVRAGRGAALALSSRIRALGAEPRGTPRGRRRPARRRRPRARRAGENRRTVRPDRPRRARRCRLRPDLRGGRAGRSLGARRRPLRRRRPDRRADDRARARHAPRPRWDRQGLHRRPRGGDPLRGRPRARRRRRRHRSAGSAGRARLARRDRDPRRHA